MAYPTNAIGYRHYDVKSVFGLGHVWDVNTLDWVPMEQPVLDGGNVTIAGTITVSGTVNTKTALTASAPAAATVGITSGQAVASNSSRKGLVLGNTSENRMSFGIGTTAVLNSGITLEPGGTWTMNEYTFTTAAIYAIAGGASSNLAIQEYT